MTRKANNQIRVTDETWEELNAMKKPGESFNDVLQRLLDQSEADDGGNRNAAVVTAN